MLLFLLTCCIIPQVGGLNAFSRWAAMRALTENGTLHIDRYTDWTIDWSRAPNGHYYSNKPPGAALLGLPLFAALDIPTMTARAREHDAFGRAPIPPLWQILFVSILMQAVPFSLLVLLVGNFLEKQHVPRAGILFFGLASLFGNTASIYMSCNYGHGLSSLLLLATLFFWVKRQYGWSSLLFGATVFSDYSGICAIPFFLVGTFWRERSFSPVPKILLGLFLPTFLWSAYHISAFGSPFTIAPAFTNPAQMELVPHQQTGWVGMIPSLSVFFKLLFGPERGVLFTQPWLFLAVTALFTPPKQRPLTEGMAIFLVGSLCATLWMNAGFGGWHGGFTVGPRYISLLFPAFAFALALRWPDLSPHFRRFCWGLLGVALGFRVLIFPFPNMADVVPLWPYHWQLYFSTPSNTPFFQASGLLLLGALAGFVNWRTR